MNNYVTEATMLLRSIGADDVMAGKWTHSGRLLTLSVVAER